MRTNTALYDTNTIHRCPAWNHPSQPKYAAGDRVVTFSGVVGTINSILHAPSTSAMRCREHHYYVAVPGKARLLVMESEISLSNIIGDGSLYTQPTL